MPQLRPVHQLQQLQQCTAVRLVLARGLLPNASQFIADASQNPVMGKCLSGDFSGPLGNQSAVCVYPGHYPTTRTSTTQTTTATGTTTTTTANRNTTTTSTMTTSTSTQFNGSTSTSTTPIMYVTASWTYAGCPPRDYCSLGTINCIGNSTCMNAASYAYCKCNAGYNTSSPLLAGTSANPCLPICRVDCANGKCYDPNVCTCNLGWAGPICDVDCGCNLNAKCIASGSGYTCGECLFNTTGPTCDACDVGFFGSAVNATVGCRKCNCNGHGDPLQGVCNVTTGECFCDASTYGASCENCKYGFAGSAINGSVCYAGCNVEGRASSSPAWSHRMYLNATSGQIGMQRDAGNPSQPVFDNSTCIWFIQAPPGSTITLTFSRLEA